MSAALTFTRVVLRLVIVVCAELIHTIDPKPDQFQGYNFPAEETA